MHPPDVKAHALELIAAGHNDCQVSRMIGIPRATVRDWRRPVYVPREPRIPRITCPRCWRSAKPIALTAEDYAELLGLYLCDGHIAIHPRAQRLRIFLDAKYPVIVSEAAALLERCFTGSTVGIQVAHGGTMKIVYIYSNHLLCLFPQHGVGKKHERPITLEPWQRDHLEAAPWSFIRACIRSDGCCFVNRTNIHRPEPYEYLSYGFSNMSTEIKDLFVDACDRVGVFSA